MSMKLQGSKQGPNIWPINYGTGVRSIPLFTGSSSYLPIYHHRLVFMAIYSVLRWRRKNSTSSLSSLSTSPRTGVNEDAMLGWDPGQIIIYDYSPSTISMDTASSTTESPIKCIQWNIERGYRLDAVISTLKSYQADIICLQALS